MRVDRRGRRTLKRSFRLGAQAAILLLAHGQSLAAAARPHTIRSGNRDDPAPQAFEAPQQFGARTQLVHAAIKAAMHHWLGERRAHRG